MSARVLVPLGVALIAALQVQVTGQVLVPALAVLLALGCAVAGPRVALPQAAQALVGVGTAMVVFVLALLDTPIPAQAGGPKLQYVVFSGTALLAMGPRLALHNPEWGHRVTWLFGLLAFFSLGRVSSTAYVPLVLAYLGLAWLHAAWPIRPSRRTGLVGAAAVAVALAVGASLTVGLRAAYVDIDKYIIANATGTGTVGFSAGSFKLGSMEGIRDSDEVILRVYGGDDDHFRGQVYNAYGAGMWFPPDPADAPASPGPRPSGEVTVIEFVAEDQERLFLPPGAGSVAVEPGGVRVDALGIPRATDAPSEVRFDRGLPRFTSPPPTEADLRVPPDVADAIGAMVDDWTAGASTDAQRLDRIVERMEADYTYSLHYERDADRDPVLQFMTDSRLGHCEYFASGTALAARHAGLPARVVTGFRTDEVSPFGGHTIVRANDAHAWVEVWVDDAWVQVDPSPRSIENGSFIAGATDDLRVVWNRWGIQALVVVLILVFVGLQVRTLLRGRKPPAPEVEEAWIEGPPEYLRGVLLRLAEQDLVRDVGEPVEVFADRAHEAGQQTEAGLLRRYAALRYGGVGDPAALAQDCTSPG